MNGCDLWGLTEIICTSKKAKIKKFGPHFIHLKSQLTDKIPPKKILNNFNKFLIEN